MNSLDGTPVSRRVVIDAEDLGYPKPAWAGRGSNSNAPRRRKRRKTNGNKAQQERRQDHDNIDLEPLSIEIQPLIKAAVAYGRKTHALGAMRAASALSSFVERLRALEVRPPGLDEIVAEAEGEAATIRAMLCESYET